MNMWWLCSFGEGVEMDNVTASEIAGLGVGALLLCATIAAPSFDSFISSSQRSLLGICKKCGNLKKIACTKCRGSGIIKEGSFFSFDLADDSDSKSKVRSSSACANCQGRGHFSCPDCAKSLT